MAARLPDALPLNGPQGRRPSRPNLGLGEVVSAVEGLAATGTEILDRQAQDEAGRLMTTFQADFQARAAERMAAYDGSSPGFALAEAEQFDRDFSAFEATVGGDGLTRKALRERRDQARGTYAAGAIEVESRMRAGIVSQRRAAMDEQALATPQLAFGEGYIAGVAPLYDRFDGSDPEAFVPGVLSAFDAATAKARETVPERLQPRFDAWAGGERGKEAAKALAHREAREDAAVATTAAETFRTATNQVLRDPSRYDANSAIVDTALAALPPALRDRVAPGARQDMAVAYLQGLSQLKQVDEAKRQIASGRFDGILEPEVTARLVAAMDRPTVADYLNKADVQDRAQSAIASRATGGKGDQTSVAEVEASLGAEAAAEFTRKQAAADRLYGAVGPLHELSGADIAARVEAARPKDKESPTYAADLAAFETLQKAAGAETARRSRDPAAWSLSAGDGTFGSPSDLLRGKFDAWTTAKPADKPRLAADYGRAILARQEQAGIAPADRRLFPKSVMSAWIADLKSDEPKTRREGLDRLGRVVEQFGAYRGQVVRELKLAGAPARDIEAVATASETGDPGRVAAYAYATTNPAALKPLEDGQTEKALTARILREATPYLDSLLPLDASQRAQNAILDRVQVEARAAVLKGESVADAVEQAMKPYDRYRFRGTWRIPAEKMKGETPVNRYGGLNAIEQGTRLVLRDVTAEDGKWLKASPDPATGKPMPSKAFAAVVRERGRWVTTADDSGLQLMILTPAGWFPILDNGGKPIRRTFEYLAKKRPAR